MLDGIRLWFMSNADRLITWNDTDTPLAYFISFRSYVAISAVPSIALTIARVANRSIMS